jgi:hypothetical protein
VRGEQSPKQQLHGDMIGKGNVKAGNIAGSVGVAIGRGTQAAVGRNVGDDEIARLFAAIYQTIEASPGVPAETRAEALHFVQRIHREALRGDAANLAPVERGLTRLIEIAPDVAQSVAAALMNPVVAPGIRGMVEKMPGVATAAPPSTGFDAVMAAIDAANLELPRRDHATALAQRLRVELERGESADVRGVRAGVEELLDVVPGSRVALRQWIESGPTLAMPIRMLTRYLLA